LVSREISPGEFEIIIVGRRIISMIFLPDGTSVAEPVYFCPAPAFQKFWAFALAPTIFSIYFVQKILKKTWFNKIFMVKNTLNDQSSYKSNKYGSSFNFNFKF
jgi:hypothetical protein